MLTAEPYSIVNIRVDLDKNLDKDVFHTIKTGIGYPLKSASNKINHVIFSKLAQIMKNNLHDL